MCPVEGVVPGEGEREDPEHLEVKEFDADEESGQRAPIKVADPKLPSAEEIEAHNLTHLPYR